MADEMLPNNGNTETGSMSEPADGPDLDAVFDLLSHRYRRTIVDLLVTHDRELTTNDIRNKIAKQEQDVDITEISSERAMEIHLTLHHAHLPKLDEAGVVHYDHEQQLVEPTEKLQLLYRYLPE